MARIEFDTTPFVRSHMREPRGRGSWAFCPYGKHKGGDYLDHTFFSPSMTYAEAKKWAREHPTLSKCAVLAVLP